MTDANLEHYKTGNFQNPNVDEHSPHQFSECGATDAQDHTCCVNLVRTSSEIHEPLLVTVSQACRLIGFKKTKTFELLRDGQLDRRKFGRATRVTMASIKRFVAGKDA